MLTARDAAYSCLAYIGEFSLTLTQYEAPASNAVFRELLRAINGALEELFELNPGLFKKERGALVKGPQQGTLGVSGGSDEVTTAFTNLAGNTIQIAGQEGYNALRTENAQKRLLYPYSGEDGTVAATLYGDALLLDPALSRPLGPVWLNDIRILDPIAGKTAMVAHDTQQGMDSDWGFRPPGANTFPTQKTVGQPTAYFCDTCTCEEGTGQVTQVVIYLSPLPDRPYTLRFDAGVKPKPVGRDQIGAEEDDDPNHYFGLPGENDHHFLLPLILYRWSRSPFFKDKDAKAQLAREYADVLPKIGAWKIQPETGGGIVTRGWR